jgi:putative phosphoesterase
MKIAVLGDIHANLPALEAVMDALRGEGVERVVHTGDVVGLGPFPMDTVSALFRYGIDGVRGNFDEAAAFDYELPVGTLPDDPEAVDYATSLRWTRDAIDFAAAVYLRDLPFETRIDAGGREVAVYHANPFDSVTPVHEGTPDHTLREIAREAHADVVVCGYTHWPFHSVVDRVHVVNAGSVGVPADKEAHAHCLVLDVDWKVQVELRRVPYDVDRTISEVTGAGLPPRFGDWFRAPGRAVAAVV